jgi:thiosulfate/3-mercaptopyruvate sulfurtransferase
MKSLLPLAVLLLLAVPPVTASEVPPLVDADWLASNLKRADLRVLDIQEAEDYARFHVPGAVNAPYARWRTSPKDAKAPSMLPPVAQLEGLIGGLGIDNASTLVIVPTGRGASDLAAAARVFWTFKVLGHGPVAILDGGLVAWAQAGNPVEGGNKRPERVEYTANVDSSQIITADEAKARLDAGAEFVDARSEGEFVGLYTGAKGERPGTIPGSDHLPHDWIAADGSARMRSPEALKALFAARGVGSEGEQVHFCHSGNRAALTWFAAYAVLGNAEARLYDGSTMEWARRSDLPLVQHLQLCGPGVSC